MDAKNIFENYATYLTDCIAEIKFVDKDKLREYLRTHLNLFYSECLDDHLLPDIDKRYNHLVEENQRLVLARAEMEEQILVAKSDLKERKYVDTAWLARLNYNFKLKGIQINNNNIELKKIWNIKVSLEKNNNIEKANNLDRAQLVCFKKEFAERFGKEAMIEFLNAADKRLDEKFKKTFTTF